MGRQEDTREATSDFMNAVARVAARLGDQPFFLSIQRGLTMVVPLVMVGAMALMVRDMPFPAARSALNALFGPAWISFCDNLVAGSFGIASLAVLCSFAYSLASLDNRNEPGRHVSAGMSAAIVLSCFFVVTSPPDAHCLRDFLSLDRGLLVALAVAAAAGQLFLRLARIRWMRLPLSAAGQDPVIHDVLTVMPAGMATILVFALLRSALHAWGAGSLEAASTNLLVELFRQTGDGLGRGLAYMGLSQAFWLVGAHGPNILYGVEQGLLAPASADNMLAAASGQDLPYIVTKPFLDAFASMGGSGCTLGLIIAILLRSRDAGSRKMCLFALAPALCNVNEPLLFGLPLVFNPVYALAFVATPLVLAATAYAATAMDWVPRTMMTISWTVPPFLSGYAATGSWAGAAMQAANLAVATAIYLPFVSLADRVRDTSFRHALGLLARSAAGEGAGPRGSGCLQKPGVEGRLAKALANDLATALEEDSQLFLEYQPQCEGTGGRVVGVEALLRWRHPVHGLIAPPIAVALAEEASLIDRLGLWVIREACAQRSAWSRLVGQGMTISVNLSPWQFQDGTLPQRVAAVLSECGLNPAVVEVEITESVAVLPDVRTLATLRALREAGVRVAIDDFGMGHASLRYLRQFPVDALKIDRSLTMDSPGGVNDHIVTSIVALSANLGCALVVEGVETREQLERFKTMGCRVFQGYYFSPPLCAQRCLKYILDKGRA